jgi:epoxyqueuosine reductase
MRVSETGTSVRDGLEYRVLEAGRLRGLCAEFRSILDSGTLSDHPTFREYVGSFDFSPPTAFPDSTPLVVVAHRAPPATASIAMRGDVTAIPVPPQYFDDGFGLAQARSALADRLGAPEGTRFEAARVPLKFLAASSGLARYGRNNICYVGSMGSEIRLRAFWVDLDIEGSPVVERRLLDECEGCSACVEACPTSCIPADGGPIDAGRCLSLYNETDLPFPDWMPYEAHNALIGCFRCQLACPANAGRFRSPVEFEPLDEEETEGVLASRSDPDFLAIVGRKMSGFAGTADPVCMAIFSRNLRAFLRARGEAGPKA